MIRKQLMYIVYILWSRYYGSVNSPMVSDRPSNAVTRIRETAWSRKHSFWLIISEALIHGQLASSLWPEAWQNFILDYVSLGRVKLYIKRKIHSTEDMMNQDYSCHGREKMPASLDSPYLVFWVCFFFSLSRPPTGRRKPDAFQEGSSLFPQSSLEWPPWTCPEANLPNIVSIKPILLTADVNVTVIPMVRSS